MSVKEATTDDRDFNTVKALQRSKLFLLVAGFATKSNGIFVSLNQTCFNLDYTEAMLAPSCFFLASLIGAPLSGAMIQKYGYRQGILWALLICALSCLSMTAAHLSHHYFLFLAALFFFGAGVKALLVAGASYSMAVGAKSGESGRVNLAQAFYSVGSVSAPLVISWVLLQLLPQPYVPSITYLFLFIIWGMLWLAISRLTQLPTRHDREKEKVEEKVSFFTPSLIGAFFCMFFYMGMEVCLDSSIVKFLTDPQGGHLDLSQAISYFVFYHLGFVVGRFIGSSVLKRIAPSRVLLAHALVGGLLFFLALSYQGAVATWSMLALGLANSILYPTIIALGVQDQPRCSAKATGFLNMASIGGAVFPPLQGMLADAYGLHGSFYLLFICFAAIIAYALYMKPNI